MSRIDEIKELRDEMREHSFISFDECVAVEDAIIDLLSKLDAAEKALEECGAYEKRANCHWCGGKIKEITTEALQQLRS